MLVRLVGRSEPRRRRFGQHREQRHGPRPDAGFSVFSLNGGYRLKRALLITAGVDNLLDRTYAEHISQAGAMVPGFVQTTRVNEPGRTIWVTMNVAVR